MASGIFTRVSQWCRAILRQLAYTTAPSRDGSIALTNQSLYSRYGCPSVHPTRIVTDLSLVMRLSSMM